MSLFADHPASIADTSRKLNETLHYAHVDTPAGLLVAARSATGIVLADFVDTPLADQPLLEQVRTHFPDCALIPGAITLHDLQTLPLHLVGTEFQCRVWRALTAIPSGSVCHYQDIAAEIGSGARAVGTAVARNRIALRIPCHRVVPSGGGTGEYRWGARRKAQLLASEGILLAA